MAPTPDPDPAAGRRWLARAASRLLRLALGLELRTIILMALIGLGLYSFLEIADEIVEGDSHEIDRRILLAMRAADDPTQLRGPSWLEHAAIDLTALGGVTVLALLTTAVASGLLLQRRRRETLLVLAAVLGGLTLSHSLKMGFNRPRPDVVPHLVPVSSASFPSGHSTMSAATFLTLGALLARLDSRKRFKAFALGWALALTLLVGLSRVYLGVHWPTDVAGGWAAGATWAMICWLATRALQRRGEIANAADLP